MSSSAPPVRPPRRPTGVAATNSQRSPPATTGTANGTSGTTLVAKGSVSRASPTPKAPPPIRRTTASSRPNSIRSDSRDAAKDGITGSTKDTDTHDSLDASRDEKNYDELRLRIQDLDGTVSSLAAENASLQTSLNQAETRISELYADQARMDEELSVRNNLAEKLRAQLRELEKEKRDLTRRYNEQTSTFEAERQSFYDNEQHLKSRIQALSQSRKEVASPRKQRAAELDDNASIVSEIDDQPQSYPEPAAGSKSTPVTRRRGETITPSRNFESEESEPAEMTTLKLELSTLSTSHASLQSTVHLLQTQLLDLQRVNAELQEENEGWKVLVQQRTLAGTFDILTLGGAAPQADKAKAGEDASSVSNGRNSTLDQVSEMDEIAYEAGITDPATADPKNTLDASLFGNEIKRTDSPASRHSRRRGSTVTNNDGNALQGETLADLPITGPGLDLAAELGRAQNAEGFIDGQGGNVPKKAKSAEETRLKNENDTLRTENKNLKDANKALSLYASKIIDRIIATEGFENVLAVDFQDRGGGSSEKGAPKSKARPGSLLFGVGGVIPDAPRSAAPVEKLTTFESIGLSKAASNTPAATPVKPSPAPPKAADDPRRSRRSMSFDWRGFSLFGGAAAQTEAEKKANDPSLRPLTLRPGAPQLTANPSTMSARKLETAEDDEDRRERERLRATMRLMGIDPAKEGSVPPTPMEGPSMQSFRSATQERTPTAATTSQPTAGAGAAAPGVAPNSRWSFFGRKNTAEVNPSASSSSSSLVPGKSVSPALGAPLTAEALEQAEAESHLAALDAREKVVMEEIAKGGSGGFTELTGPNGAPRRRLGEEWRSRRNSQNLSGGADMVRSRSLRKEGSSAGSASTVWSAGKDDD